MKWKLINEPNKKFTPLAQILYNRGLTNPQEMKRYINTSDADVAEPELLGESALHWAAAHLISTIANKDNCFIVVDCDCDGFTSSAILLNYLHEVFPSWVENNVKYFLHSGKQHGLSDCIDLAMEEKYKLIIIPDAGSNDFEYHKMLAEAGKKIIVLDHHLADKISDYAVIINNQLSDYPNKNLSGAGIAWQFCRFLDKMLRSNRAENYYDLLALGLTGDMMSQLEIETKHLIHKGFNPDNIHNPFIYEMWQKNEYKLGDHITPMGAAFYIVPFVNAICRSGTLEEKQLVFESMLKYKAFEQVLSTKRGHRAGETERLVDQALRTCTNVKNRQTKAQDAGMKVLEQMIIDNNMLDHKVLLFLLDKDCGIPAEIRGLIANKFMAKYQRPCCILTLTYTGDELPWEEEEDPNAYSYQGSARGYDKSGITNFKSICDNTHNVTYTAGHEGAFGIGIAKNDVTSFLAATDYALKDLSSDPVYFVDYEFTPTEQFGETVLDIADMKSYWGKDVDEAMILVRGITVNCDNFKVMKSNTIKISLPNGIDIIKFRAKDAEIDTLSNGVEINAVCYCRKNEWNWQINPQLELVDYEVIDSQPTIFSWGF